MSEIKKLVFPESNQEVDFDGGGGDDTGVDIVNIKVVSNGFLVTTEYDDGEVLEEICYTLPEVLDIIQENIDV